MFMEQKRTLSLLVDNTPGLLSRVAGLFSRRGYNIETITAGVTADPRYTRMTVVLYCSDEMILEQIKKQLNRMVEVIKVIDVDVGQESLIVELTGNQSKLEGFLNLVQGYEILELARTGVTGLSRGVHDVRYLD